MIFFIKTSVFISLGVKKFKKEKKSNLCLKKENRSQNFLPLNLATPDKNFLKKAFLFTEHLIFQNFYMNLISKFSTKILYKNHFFDSLTLLASFFSFWPRNLPKSCIDVGSGGGFPGLVLSFYFPNFFFCLIDSVGKKTKFHKIIFQALKIKNSESVCQRAELIKKFSQHKNFYNFTLTRAVAEVKILSRICLPLTKKNGKLIIMKKILNLNEELKEGFIPLYSEKGKIKSFTHIHPINQGKTLLLIKKTQ